MSGVVVAAVAFVCVVSITALAYYARAEYRGAKKALDRIKKLESALADPEVVDIVQRMIRDPMTENPKSFLEKRRNKKHALLLIRLRTLVEDKETRKLIYRFIKQRSKPK